MVLGSGEVGSAARRDFTDRLCSDPNGRGRGICRSGSGQPQFDASSLGALCRATQPRVLPHSSRHRLRADLCRCIRTRCSARRIGYNDPHHGRARQTLHRGGGKYRHGPRRRCCFDRGQLALSGTFRGNAAGAVKPRQLRVAAVRGQCARSDGDRLCRGGRHRPRPDRRHPQILLLRCQRDAVDDHRDGDGDRHALGPAAAPPAGDGEPAVNASGVLRAMSLAQSTELRRRYPETLVVGWRRKVPLLALCAAAIGVYFVGLMILDISPAKIVSGIGRLVDIVALILPPDPESWARVLLYLGALGQTLAIAFLGTMLGAVIGCPFGLLAARNVVANRLIHLLTRRSLDTVRSVDILIWALIWINVVGLGPFAGALAIMSAD